MHLLNEEGVVAEIADAPFGIAHAFAMLDRKVALPLQAERRSQIIGVPPLLRRTVIFEIIHIKTDSIDDVVARIGQIRRKLLRSPSRTPVVFEVVRVAPEYSDHAPESPDVV